MQIVSNIFSVVRKMALFSVILLVLAVVARIEPGGQPTKTAQTPAVKPLQIRKMATLPAIHREESPWMPGMSVQ